MVLTIAVFCLFLPLNCMNSLNTKNFIGSSILLVLALCFCSLLLTELLSKPSLTTGVHSIDFDDQTSTLTVCLELIASNVQELKLMGVKANCKCLTPQPEFPILVTSEKRIYTINLQWESDANKGKPLTLMLLTKPRLSNPPLVQLGIPNKW